MPKTNSEPTLLRKLAWFVLLWCLGVATVTAVGAIIKWAL